MVRFGQYFKNQKNRFPIVFSKTDFPGPPFLNRAKGLEFSGSTYFYANNDQLILWNNQLFFLYFLAHYHIPPYQTQI